MIFFFLWLRSWGMDKLKQKTQTQIKIIISLLIFYFGKLAMTCHNKQKRTTKHTMCKNALCRTYHHSSITKRIIESIPLHRVIETDFIIDWFFFFFLLLLFNIKEKNTVVYENLAQGAIVSFTSSTTVGSILMEMDDW